MARDQVGPEDRFGVRRAGVTPNVRLGSDSDLGMSGREVRLAPDSGQPGDSQASQLRAIS